jgi:hypothetical protein
LNLAKSFAEQLKMSQFFIERVVICVRLLMAFIWLLFNLVREAWYWRKYLFIFLSIAAVAKIRRHELNACCLCVLTAMGALPYPRHAKVIGSSCNVNYALTLQLRDVFDDEDSDVVNNRNAGEAIPPEEPWDD